MASKSSPLSRYLWKAALAIGLSSAAIVGALAIWTRATTPVRHVVWRPAVAEGGDVQEAAKVVSMRARALRRELKLISYEVYGVPPNTVEMFLRTRGDLQEAVAWLTMRGNVEFRLLHPRGGGVGAPGEAPPAGYELKVYRQKTYDLARGGELTTREHFYLVESQPMLAIRSFKRVALTTVGFQKRVILTFWFHEADAKAFAALTALHAGRRMAMLVDGEMYLPPAEVPAAITGGCVQAEGYFYLPPLRRLVKVLNLPFLSGPREPAQSAHELRPGPYSAPS